MSDVVKNLVYQFRPTKEDEAFILLHLERVTFFWNALVQHAHETTAAYFEKQSVTPADTAKYEQDIWAITQKLIGNAEGEADPNYAALVSEFSKIPRITVLHRMNDYIRAVVTAKQRYEEDVSKKPNLPSRKTDLSNRTMRFGVHTTEFRPGRIAVDVHPPFEIQVPEFHPSQLEGEMDLSISMRAIETLEQDTFYEYRAILQPAPEPGTLPET